MVIFDHINKTLAVVAHAHVDAADPARSYADACRRVDELVERLQRTDAELPLCDITSARDGSVQRPYQSNFAPADFEKAVEKAKEYIRAGDIFQVVLSQRFATQTTARAVRHLPDAAGGQSEPVHVLSFVRAAIAIWSAARRRSWCASRGTR